MRRLRQLHTAIPSTAAPQATSKSDAATVSKVEVESEDVSEFAAPSEPEPEYLLVDGTNIGKEEAERLRLKIETDGRFGSFSGRGSATLETARSRDGYGFFCGTTEGAAVKTHSNHTSIANDSEGKVIVKKGKIAGFRG